MAVTGTYECTGYSGIESKVPVSMVLQDTFVWGDDPPYQVGDGTGDINWRSDPYNKPSWYMWLHSLRWLGQGIKAATNGDRKALTHVMAIIHDWVRDNPYSWKGDVGAWESTMHRTNVLICAAPGRARRTACPLTAGAVRLAGPVAARSRQVHDRELGRTVEPRHRREHRDVRRRLHAQAGRSEEPRGRTADRGDHDRDRPAGVDERAVGRVRHVQLPALGPRDHGAASGAAPTQDGSSTNDAARWRSGSPSPPSPPANSSRSATPIRQTPQGGTGTALEYAATLGRHGIRNRPERTAVFDAGYVFGRTGWGETRPFAQESTYSIRFGPGRRLHGHDDHMSITYTSHGRDILIDPGHSGYQLDKWQAWTKSQAAHNVMTIPSANTASVETRLVRAAIAPTSEYYTLHRQPGAGVQRTRDVLVLKDPDLIVTLDRGQSATDQRYETLWHLAPDQKVTVQSPTTAVAAKPGDSSKTYLLQIPYRQQLPADAITVAQGQQDPVQGWYFPDIFHRLPAPVVKFNRTATTATILSAVVPAASTETVAFSTRTVGTMFFVDLTVGARKTTIRVQPDGRLTRIS